MKINIYLTIIILFVILSCSSNNSQDIVNKLPDTSTHQLVEKFRIIDHPDNIFFNRYIRQIDFFSNGNIVIRGNYSTRNLYEIDPQGNLVSIIGREGNGPGEFQSIDRILTTPDDKLHVFDRRLSRHQVFKKNNRGGWEIIDQHLRESEMNNNEFNVGFPLEVFNSKEQGYRALMTNNIGFSDTTDSFYNFITEVDSNLIQTTNNINLSLLKPVQSAAIVREGGVLTITHGGFDKSFYLYNEATEQIIYFKNSSNEIHSIDYLNGDNLVIGTLPFEFIPMNREIVDTYLENASTNYDKKTAELLESKFLEHEPYYDNTFLDSDEQLLWIQFARMDTTAPDWGIVNLSGEILASFSDPGDFSPLTVSKNHLYGVQMQDDIPTFVSFELIEN